MLFDVRHVVMKVTGAHGGLSGIVLVYIWHLNVYSTQRGRVPGHNDGTFTLASSRLPHAITYAFHCVNIQINVPVLMNTGPASGNPHLVVLNTTHSDTKCPKAHT